MCYPKNNSHNNRREKHINKIGKQKRGELRCQI